MSLAPRAHAGTSRPGCSTRSNLGTMTCRLTTPHMARTTAPLPTTYRDDMGRTVLTRPRRQYTLTCRGLLAHSLRRMACLRKTFHLSMHTSQTSSQPPATAVVGTWSPSFDTSPYGQGRRELLRPHCFLKPLKC